MADDSSQDLPPPSNLALSASLIPFHRIPPETSWINVIAEKAFGTGAISKDSFEGTGYT